MPASVPSPYQALYRFNYSPLLLLSGSLARVTHRRASLLWLKLLWKRAEEVGVKRSLYRRSKILHCSVYSALWLVVYAVNAGDKQWALAARCPCVMVLGKKQKTILSAPSVRRPTGGNARLPIQPCTIQYISRYRGTIRYVSRSRTCTEFHLRII